MRHPAAAWWRWALLSSPSSSEYLLEEVLFKFSQLMNEWIVMYLLTFCDSPIVYTRETPSMGVSWRSRCYPALSCVVQVHVFYGMLSCGWDSVRLVCPYLMMHRYCCQFCAVISVCMSASLIKWGNDWLVEEHVQSEIALKMRRHATITHEVVMTSSF